MSGWIACLPHAGDGAGGLVVGLAVVVRVPPGVTG